MVLGIGIDNIDIIRFAHWHNYSRARLLRVFSSHDLDYCLHNPNLSAQRFAARFAVREAAYKALCTYTTTPLPFLTVCRAIEVHTIPSGAPQLVIDWQALPVMIPTIPYLSITHTATIATAIVMLQIKDL